MNETPVTEAAESMAVIVNETCVWDAAVAGWWTILIAAAWMTIAWFFWLGILKARPGWLLRLWGGIEWDYAQKVMITFMTVWKIILFVAVMLTIWLTILAGRLNGGS